MSEQGAGAVTGNPFARPSRPQNICISLQQKGLDENA